MTPCRWCWNTLNNPEVKPSNKRSVIEAIGVKVKWKASKSFCRKATKERQPIPARQEAQAVRTPSCDRANLWAFEIRLSRNFLKGVLGDQTNLLMAVAVWNLRHNGSLLFIRCLFQVQSTGFLMRKSGVFDLSCWLCPLTDVTVQLRKFDSVIQSRLTTDTIDIYLPAEMEGETRMYRDFQLQNLRCGEMLNLSRYDSGYTWPFSIGLYMTTEYI